jgi:ketosteroid isomerase-like protein
MILKKSKENNMLMNKAERNAIETQIHKYIEVISRSETDSLLSLFTEDGVVMAPDAPTMVGADQLKAFFDYGFKSIRLSPKILIDEIAVTEEFAFARCHSEVQVTLLETNASHIEANRELFVFKKHDGVWKIARYMFNKAAKTN